MKSFTLKREDNFTLKREDKEIKISGYFLNEDNLLEFRHTDLFAYAGLRYIFDKNNSCLNILGLGKTIVLPLLKEEVEKIGEIEIEIKKSLNKLYVDILKGNENLICFPTGLPEYPLHITTKTILDMGILSPKYVKALIFALTDEQLKKAGYKEQPGFIGYGDMQSRLGKHIEAKSLVLQKYEDEDSYCYVLKLNDALAGIA